ETPPVLKTFIIGLENLLCLKVKIIRCDNKTEFKNADLNQFCGLKGIKREFSIPKTPQQNGIAERKFQGKVDEGLLIGYSACSKAFRVFNSRTRVVQETLHVNFMENKPNVAGSGLAWLYRKSRGGRSSHICAFPVLSNSSINSQNNNKDALVDEKEHDDDIQKSVSPDIHSSSNGAQTRKQD
nr:putative ribonuclease H-like domain-containing protein [Tanacetum cinerariifolium]